jgi:hypothetical protein
LDAPENATILIIAYGSVQAISLLVMGLIYSKVTSKKDQTKLTYSEPKPSFQNEDPELIETTFMEYDIKQLKQLLTQTAIGVLIISFMYYKWGYLRPLLLQSVLGLKSFFGTPIVEVHILGKDKKRPWVAASPFGQQEPVSEKQVKQIEKKEAKKKISNKKTD